MVEEAQSNQVALVFGREQSGLTNEELLKCQFHVNIPSCEDYSSLNLSQAVQVVAYEVRMAYLNVSELNIEPHDEYASGEELTYFFTHLEAVLIHIGFLRPDTPKRIMPRLQRLFQRIRLEKLEVNLLRGILTAIELKTGIKSSRTPK